MAEYHVCWRSKFTNELIKSPPHPHDKALEIQDWAREHPHQALSAPFLMPAKKPPFPGKQDNAS